MDEEGKHVRVCGARTSADVKFKDLEVSLPLSALDWQVRESTQHSERSTQHADRSTQHADRSTQHADRSTQSGRQVNTACRQVDTVRQTGRHS